MNTSQTAFGSACWIGVDWSVDCGGAIGSKYFAFYQSYATGSEPQRAFVRITADSRYQLWINGQYVGRGPARSYPQFQSYDELDITRFVRAGTNHVAVLVHQFGISTAQYIHRLRSGLLMDGEMVCADGTVTMRTDLSWRVKVADWYLPSYSRLSQHTGWQERYDARMEPPGWRLGETTSNRGWRKPFYVGVPGCLPWTGFEPRGLPPLQETRVAPDGCVLDAEAEGAAEDAVNLLELWDRLVIATDGETKAAPALDGDGYRTVPLEQGKATVLVFDYGWSHTAYPLVELIDETGGTTADQYYSVELQPDGIPVPLRGFGTRHEGMADRFVSASGYSSWQAYTPRGFRYHVLVLKGSRAVRLKAAAYRVHHPVQPLAFACSDPRMEGIWQATERTLLATMLDAFVDNSTREQALWLHDDNVAQLGAWAVFGDAALWRRCLLQWPRLMTPSGTLHSIAVTEPTFMAVVDHTFAWMLSACEYYVASGDLELVETVIDTFRDILERLIVPNVTADNLFIAPEGYWTFLDWSNLNQDPYSLTLNLMLLRGLDSGRKLAAVCRRGLLAAAFDGVYTRVRQAATERFWSAADEAWMDHVDVSADVRRELDRRVPGSDLDPWRRPYDPPPLCSQHANAMAVLVELGSPEQQEAAARHVAKSLDPLRPTVNMLSPIWTEKIFGSLFVAGRDREAIQALRDWHGSWLQRGLTTWPEAWIAPGEQRVQNHAQACGSCVGILLSQYVVGIRPLQPGLTAVLFDPRCEGIDWARGEVQTRHGKIAVSWTREGERIAGELRVPQEVDVVLGESVDPACIRVIREG
ncbi:MAG: alpha-L-rhamnosidase N-terminal domain-containing protein [Paenibacillaceae bacterium]|nr:alpha-L-rhamnosidase N-terminal domain-containing protein [Paenibacillaceae bacterium]